MNHRFLRRRALAAALMLLCAAATANEFVHPDHHEFDAMLDAPFQAVNGRWPIVLRFDYPVAGDITSAAWTLQAIAPDGRLVESWSGITPLDHRHARVAINWSGRGHAGNSLASGYYTLRLRAAPTVELPEDAGKTDAQRIAEAFAAFAEEIHEQDYTVMVGKVSAARTTPMKPMRVGARSHRPERAAKESTQAGGISALSVPAENGLPYTIYYGNFHSQTNHSDGGTPVASCGGSEVPQGGTYGPADAYAMMRTQAGGDFLLTSEHNHMYDGSTSTNTSANPATAIALFDSGVQAASDYRTANPSFMALYGLEWGVISNGGHLNLINPDALAAWELNSSGQLIGEVNTPKSDYPALYATMQSRGWIGQFNHPASSGQFLVNGTALGYDANGAQVMVLAEILNSSAFSTNTTETETGRSSYTGAWNILLERGYKVAPASNQDNHCANWGLSFTNRTGVLLPSSATLTATNFTDALRARRAFATEDKTGQLVLTGNGHVMGETFANSGALTLTANYASTSGQTVQRVQFFEGVPGRNGTVTQLTEGSDTHSFTPAAGEHFYYALVTQANGLRLWSAPLWVSQSDGPPPTDTTPPSVTASESGSSGTITFNASASDNVGVTNVEFYVDGVLKGSDSTTPYALSFDSTTLADGSHTLTAKAFDAAGNNALSAGVAFSVDNSTPPPTAFAETEGNGSVSAANTVARGYSQITGSMGNSSDKDYFKLTLNPGETLRIDMAGPSGNYDYDLYLVDGTDKTLKKSTGSTANETITYVNGATTKAVYAKVIAYSGSGVGQPYTLSLTYSGSASSNELVGNGGFESGVTVWNGSNGVISNDVTQAARTGSWKAWLNGYGSAHTDTLSQQLSIPSTVTNATLNFWLRVASDETTTTTAYDTLKVQVRNTSGGVLVTLATYSNLNKGSSYVQRTFDLSSYKGQTVVLYFEGIEGTQVATSFLIDDVSVATQ